MARMGHQASMDMPNTPITSGRVQYCGKCGTTQPIEGGVDLGPGRWRCALCWIAARKKALGIEVRRRKASA